MADMRTFTVVGYSLYEGVEKVRVANNGAQARANVLIKCGHTNVRLIDLPKPMTKDRAEEWLKAYKGEIPVMQPAEAPRERITRGPAANRTPREKGPTNVAVGEPRLHSLQPTGGGTAGPGRPPRRSQFITAFHPPLTKYTGQFILHEELGRAHCGKSKEFWESSFYSLESKQEFSRNAAWAAGIDCPKGTYPELEKQLEMDGYIVNQDGTITDPRLEDEALTRPR